jgi:hypothetical protein
MNAYQAWQCYLAMKMHFTTDYDIVKYKGKVRTSVDAFNRRKNIVFMFQKLAKVYKDEELINYFLSNFVSNPKWDLGSLNNEDSREQFLLWKKRIESLTYTFRQDIEHLCNIHNLEAFDESIIFQIKQNQHPLLLKEFLAKKINLETLVILNRLYGFVETFDKSLDDKLVWGEVSFLIKKYNPFIKINKERYNEFIRGETCIS